VYISKRGADRRRGCRRGGSAAELALIAPVLIFALLLAIDFCRVFFAYSTITNAARNGALWASDPLASTQSPYTSLLLAASADAGNLNPALTSSNVTSSNPSTTTVTVTVSYQFPLITSYLGLSRVNLARQVTMLIEPLSP
jgi:Flp pilus assembly protein TadG